MLVLDQPGFVFLKSVRSTSGHLSPVGATVPQSDRMIMDEYENQMLPGMEEQTE
jgi:hypothetical protein